MIQNKNQQFLSSQTTLALYLSQLIKSTKSLDNKIRQQKQKAHELLFNISTLFGIPTTRNKIQEKMIKNGVVIPESQISQSQFDQIVQKIVQKNTEEVLQSTNNNDRQFKRNLQIGQDQQGLIPNKKRHIQSENKNERSKNQSNSSENISSKQNTQKINNSSEN